MIYSKLILILHLHQSGIWGHITYTLFYVLHVARVFGENAVLCIDFVIPLLFISVGVGMYDSHVMPLY